MVKESGSPNEVAASSNETPWAATFCPALRASHSNVTAISCATGVGARLAELAAGNGFVAGHGVRVGGMGGEGKGA